MSNVLRQLCRATETQSVARHFIEEWSDELSSVPQATSLVAAIRSSAAKSKAITAEERNAGHALYRLIRDAFDATLRSTTPPAPKVLVATPMPPPVPIKRLPATDENGKVPKEKRVSSAAASQVRATIALPLVKVDVVPEPKRKAAIMAFFRDARRVEHTQAALKDGCEIEAPNDARYWDGVFSDGEGLDPRDVLRTHRNIIGSDPEGHRILTEYEHYRIGPYAALDLVRRRLLLVYRGGPLPTMITQWHSRAPHGTETPEHRHYIATMRALPDEGKPYVTYLPKGDLTVVWFRGKSSVDTPDP